jgi:hypothetical protein
MGPNKAVSKTKAAPKKAVPKKAAAPKKVVAKATVKQVSGPTKGGAKKKTNAGVVPPTIMAQKSTEDEKKRQKVLNAKFLLCKDQLECKLARAAIVVDFNYTVKDGVITINTKKCLRLVSLERP